MLGLVGLFVLAGCGDANENDNNDDTSRQVCEDMTPPEEVEDCVAFPEGESQSTAFRVRNLEQLCQSKCNKIEALSLSNAIESLAPLKNIREVRGAFLFGTVIGLESLDGVENIEIIGSAPYEASGVNITGPDLVSTEGFDSLHTIQARQTVIRNTDKLRTIEGFPNLERIEEGGLAIIYNEKLEDISGLQQLKYVGGPVVIENNPELPRCEAQAFVDGIDTITGEVTIQNNGTGSCE